MTTRTTLLLLALILAHELPAQPRLDVGTGGRQDVRAIMGGGGRVTLDTETPLEVLIARLDGPWEERETGKGYWIGYTDDMYSIAARGEPAIAPLLRLATTSESEHTRYGAMLTIHLLGIDRCVVGRFREDFRQPRARTALLDCAHHDRLREHAMLLLMRDPWLSDVPHLMDAMRGSAEDCWTILDALHRYQLEDSPLDASIPESIVRIALDCEKPEDVSDEDFFWVMLQRVKAATGDVIVIEDGLQSKPLWGDSIGFPFTRPDSIPRKVSVGGFLHRYVGPEPSDAFSYCHFGNRVQRYREGDVVHICSAETAKRRWLAWWDTRSPDYREALVRWTKAADSPAEQTAARVSR